MHNFQNVWRYEAVRLLELANTSLSEASANQLASLSPGGPAAQLHARAMQLANVHKVEQPIHEAMRWSYRLMWVFWLLSLFAGVSAGLTVLGDANSPINVLWALGSVLLVPTITLVLWLSSIGLGIGSGGWLGHWWQIVMGRLSRRGQDAVVWQAWLKVADAAQMQRWWFAFLTHTMWFWMMSGVVIATVLAFSLRHYTFMWQTTWLSSDTFVVVAQAIGRLPADLGFEVPDASMIEASGNAVLDEPLTRAAWANWFVGAVVVFGWFPRFVAAITSYLILRHRDRHLSIRTDDAYAISVLDRLASLNRGVHVDAPNGEPDTLGRLQGIEPRLSQSQAAALAVETDMPPELLRTMSKGVQVLPDADDRQTRMQALSSLEQLRPANLLLVLDARLTPDRGSLGLILQFGIHAVRTSVFLANSNDNRARLGVWREKLEMIGVPAPLVTVEQAVDWLFGQS